MLDMNLLRETRLITGLFIVPRQMPPQSFPHKQLSILYSRISEKYEYPTFNSLPDGAVFLQPRTQSHVQVQGLLVQVNEAVELHFDQTKQKVVDILSTIYTQLQLGPVANHGVKLIATLPVPGEKQASSFIEEKYLKISDTAFGILGAGRVASGLRFHFVRRSTAYDLHIEPSLRNLSQLWIDIDIQYRRQFEDLSDLGERIQASYEFLFGEVKSFLESPA